MIIDSHAHYNHGVFRKPFRYLDYGQEGYCLQEGDLAQLFDRLQQAGIPCSVEPGITLEGCAQVLELAQRYPQRIFPTVGVHPTRCIFEKWSNRRQLVRLAEDSRVVAVGETGLDYHHDRADQHRLKQHLWFWYQLQLACKVKKPVILHVRDAHEDALRILRHHPARKQGGVIHCFYGDWEIARRYLDLGYHSGIGGSILQPEERAAGLWEAVRQIPLERILLETDAPFILPYCKDVLPPKLLRRARNTSLILPAVAEKIAQLKGIDPETVENICAENTIRLFGLRIGG